jgi:hypothetical protein
MTYGFVYCLGHDCMPGVFKIGMTSRTPLTRCAELSAGTAVPGPFDLLFYIEVENPCEIEAALHEHFSDFRVCEDREFFKCCIGRIYFEFGEYGADGAPLAVTSQAEYLLSMVDMNAVMHGGDVVAPPGE